MSDKLKPCPFCGKDSAEIHKVGYSVYTEYIVQCGNCFASVGCSSTEKEAVKDWNTRKGGAK